MAANRFGIDVGSLYRDQENIKGARTRNKMASLQLGEAEREIEQRPIREETEKNRNIMLTDLRQKAVGGDDNASRQFLAVGGDPSFLEAVGKMDDRQLEESKRAIDEKGRMLATVRNAAPERQEGLYQQMLSMLPDESKTNMPKQYDSNFIDLALTKMITMDKILENPKAIQVGGEDVVYQRGKEIERAKRPVKTSGTGAGDGRGIKTTEENAMRSQVASLYGGMYNPKSGEFQMTDPKVLPEVQAVLERATVYYRDDKSLTASQAVKKSAEDFGVKFPSPNETGYKEGTRIKNPSTGEFMIMKNGQWTPEQ